MYKNIQETYMNVVQNCQKNWQLEIKQSKRMWDEKYQNVFLFKYRIIKILAANVSLCHGLIKEKNTTY